MQKHKEILEFKLDDNIWQVEIEWYEDIILKQAFIDVKMLNDFADRSNNEVVFYMGIIADEIANMLNENYKRGNTAVEKASGRSHNLTAQYFIGSDF